MRNRAPDRGVTLLELLIAMAVTAIVLAGAIVVVTSQEKAYYGGQRLRGAQANGRRALLALEETLPRAGFGMDASLALDLSGWHQGPCRTAEMGTCLVDATDNSDELVFYARDPKYWIPETNGDDPVGHAWRITSVTSSDVTLSARAGDSFRMGQIFLAVCPGSSSYAYFTAAANVDVVDDVPSTIPLRSVVSTNPFRRQDVAAANPCFSTAPPGDPARLFLVNRYRFHVRPAAVGAIGSATQYDPLLVLDQGIDADHSEAVDENDEQIIAEGIESIQVSYLFYESAIPPAGATSGTQITRTAGAPSAATTQQDVITTTLFPGAVAPGQSPYAPSSFYAYTFGPPPANERGTNHQANIQAIRIAVLARSQPDPVSMTPLVGVVPLYNQSALPAWVTAPVAAAGGSDGHQRIVLETTINLPNMSTRAMTYF